MDIVAQLLIYKYIKISLYHLTAVGKSTLELMENYKFHKLTFFNNNNLSIKILFQ